MQHEGAQRGVQPAQQAGWLQLPLLVLQQLAEVKQGAPIQEQLRDDAANAERVLRNMAEGGEGRGGGGEGHVRAEAPTHMTMPPAITQAQG